MTSQHRAFNFLRQRCANQHPFTLSEFQTATGFSNASFKTYFSKQFRSLLIPAAGDNYRVHFGFRRFNSWEKFRDEVVTQNRNLVRSYDLECHENLLMFDFFMPLRNEEWLRSALDSLFFKDTVLPRVKALDSLQVAKFFPLTEGENEDQPHVRVCDWISDTFGGYSISHVSGRFKAATLRTRQEAVEAELNGMGRYLVDETTAVVRFIFPCPSGKNPTETEIAAERIRWFFHKLFVETILEVVNGEDQVWLLETGMRHRLHIFKAKA